MGIDADYEERMGKLLSDPKAHPFRDEAARLLRNAHAACLKANTVPAGMSHGPFSGTNEVLTLIWQLEETIRRGQTAATTLLA